MDASRWLNKAASEWRTDSDFLSNYCEFVHSTKVSNDVAEGEVAMIHTFADTVKKDDTHLQCMIQEVEVNQRKVTKLDKRIPHSISRDGLRCGRLRVKHKPVHVRAISIVLMHFFRCQDSFDTDHDHTWNVYIPPIHVSSPTCETEL